VGAVAGAKRGSRPCVRSTTSAEIRSSMRLPSRALLALSLVWAAPSQAPSCGDLNSSSGEVDVSDLLLLLAAFGTSAEGDVTGDNVTDVNDLLALLSQFGSPCSSGLRILVVGGQDGGDALATCEQYDVEADSWTAAASIVTAREGHAAAAIDGAVYVMGGYTGSFPTGSYLATAEVYSAGADAWSPVAAMSTPRYAPAAAAVGGSVYVTGGQRRGMTAVSLAEVYDTATDTWSSIASMGSPRSRHTTVALEGSIYVMGGVDVSYGAEITSDLCCEAISHLYKTEDLPRQARNKHEKS
jgi:hypothetical protein